MAVLAVTLLSPAALAKATDDETVSPELARKVLAALKDKKKELGEIKDENDKKLKRFSHGRLPRKVGDDTFEIPFIVRTAEPTKQIVERYLMTIGPDPEKKGKYKLLNEELQDTWDGIRKSNGIRCYDFKSFDFERYGMKMSATNGAMCEEYYEGGVEGFWLVSDDVAYTYNPPDYANERNLYQLWQIHQMNVDLKKQVIVEPEAFDFECDLDTCEEIITSSFKGLDREAPPSAEEAATWAKLTSVDGLPSKVHAEARRRFDLDGKSSPFAGFRRPDFEGNHWFVAGVREKGSDDDDATVALYYDNWGGYECLFFTPVGVLFGYYTEETLANTDPYELERRDDYYNERIAGGSTPNRFLEVYGVSGTVEAALEDAERLDADINFKLNIKQPIQVLPFSIVGFNRFGAGGGTKPPEVNVNLVQMDGQDLSYVKTGATSGYVLLPEPAKAGDQINLRMEFDTKAIRKLNYAFSQMARFGWMPFVRFADFIDEFDLTIKAPSQYKILGIGHKVEEKTVGEVTTSKWRADSPVVFPTIIFGKYISDVPPKEATAKKSDGTVVPVAVHVDEVSMQQLDIEVSDRFGETMDNFNSGARGIRGKQLRPIATQAAVSINMFNEISGVDYPYGELNLVNDPAPALYGQAPSSLIYLGSLVFRGEGTMAGGGIFSGRQGGGGTGTAKFLKSVVAHEVGHQWWGSRVSNANQRNYWFVESLAEFFSAIYLERAFGRGEYQEQVDEWRRRVLTVDAKSSVQDSSVIYSGDDGGASYQSAVYNKGPYAFHLMREMFGDERFFPFLKKFSQELAARREIVSRDIQVVSEEALGGVDPNTGEKYNVDLEWFFDQWIRGTGIPEYRLEYDIRKTEDGGAIIKGSIHQRVLAGSKFSKREIPGKYYRALVPLTVIGRDRSGNDQTWVKKLVLEAVETTPFQLKVPGEPIEVLLNKDGNTLSHDTNTGKSW
ncbi:hypothetical protein ABI59_12725 [Acidobacteria bacterium Mor1]|nr:hypothetical protein ABI59_12725 [Acidobacteria bacterium Mor1]